MPDVEAGITSFFNEMIHVIDDALGSEDYTVAPTTTVGRVREFIIRLYTKENTNFLMDLLVNNKHDKFKRKTLTEKYQTTLLMYCIAVDKEARCDFMKLFSTSQMELVDAYVMLLFRDVPFKGGIIALPYTPFTSMLKLKVLEGWRTHVAMRKTCAKSVQCVGSNSDVATDHGQIMGLMVPSRHEEMQQDPPSGHTCCFGMLLAVLEIRIFSYSPVPVMSKYERELAIYAGLSHY